MVYTDNKVALRQLELANKALLAKTHAKVAEGTSLAKDEKFHPRVLTLVRAVKRRWQAGATNSDTCTRVVITQLLCLCFVGLWMCMVP